MTSQSFNLHLAKYKVAIIIPFRDQVQLLVNCVDSLMHRKEEIELKFTQLIMTL